MVRMSISGQKSHFAQWIQMHDLDDLLGGYPMVRPELLDEAYVILPFMGL